MIYDYTHVYGSYRKLAALGDAIMIIIIEQDMLRKPQRQPAVCKPVEGEPGIWQVDTHYCTEEVKDAWLQYLAIPTNRPTASAG